MAVVIHDRDVVHHALHVEAAAYAGKLGKAFADQIRCNIQIDRTAGINNHPAVTRGVQYLLTTQQPDGSWEEEPFTGTGFPRVFYLKYHYYAIYFPLLALAEVRRRQLALGAVATASIQSTQQTPSPF